MSALLQNDGTSHGNRATYPNKYKSFNEQADPAWHWTTPADRLQDYRDKQDLINKTKLDVLEKD